MNKSFFQGRHPQFVGRKDLYIEACGSDAEIKSDVVMMVDNFIKERRAANVHGILKMSWTPPAFRIVKATSNSLTGRKPMRDLIPLDILSERYPKVNFSEISFPIANIYNDDGNVAYRGLLVRATDFNPPEGCLRIISDQKYIMLVYYSSMSPWPLRHVAFVDFPCYLSSHNFSVATV